MKLALALASSALALCAAGSAFAQKTPAIAPAGNGQAMLAVGYDKGVLRAGLCTTQPCSLAGGTDLKVPASYAGRDAQTKFKVVGLGDNRRAIVVTIPSTIPERAWEAVVTAPPGGGAPLVIFAGETGWTTGQPGERHGPRVEVHEDDGDRYILIGEQWENFSLCGRPAIYAPKLLDPRTMKLASAKGVQRLPSAEREAATPIVAQLVPEPPAPGPPILRATGATTNTSDAPKVTDSNLETAWSEAVGGDGRGEFVRLDVPGGLELLGIELVFRPPAGGPAKGAAPKELWLASAQRVFKVTVPDNGWKPGARYAVKFDKPLVGDCLALVLESTLDSSPGVQVSVAEVMTQTEFGDVNEKDLVAALSGGGDRAQNARRILQTRGKPAHEAVAGAFDGLDEGGRREALEVIDAAECEISVPVYMKAVVSPFEGQRTHARTRLRRCGAVAAKALAAALPTAKGAALEDLASELAMIDPGEAVRAILPLLAEKQVARRRSLRVALGRAAASQRARDALTAALADPSLPETALLDLLRALGPRLESFGGAAGAALGRLSAPDASFRVRYLRTLPAGALAARDEAARRLLSSALTQDKDAHVRAQAARVMQAPVLFKTELTKALSDPEVRVREAAAHALARPSGAFAAGALTARVSDDRWPLVRSASALALAEFASDPAVDSRLEKALEDGAWLVRRDVAVALGKRHARAQAPSVRERLEDKDEHFEVRVAAARALGEMCDKDSAGVLTSHARRLSDPMVPTELRSISYAALGSLARLGVPDLKSRLEPLLEREAPGGARAAAQAALETRPACR